MTDIDHLEIEITSNATSAEKAIAKLANSLKTLKAACQGGAGLNGIAKGVESLANAANSIGSDAGTKLSQIANAIAKISSAGYLGNTGLDKLAAAANGVNPASANAVAALANAVKPLASVGNVNLSGMASGLADLGAAADLLQGKDFSGLTMLAMSIAPLSTVSKANLSNMANGLMDVAVAADLLQGKDMTALKDMAAAIGNFKGLSLTKTFVTNFENLIKASDNIKPETAQNIEQWADALAQLGQVDLSSLARNLTAINQNAPNGLGMGNLTSAINHSAPGILASFKLISGVVKTTWNAIGGFVNRANQYIEDVNLFTASLGKFATQAGEYAQKVGEVMGIDPGTWMRYQGVFQVLAEGFGVASDRAYIMSKNLTQLGYDISSFYNLDVDKAMLKLQSGLAGELEPLRRIGYDLSEARLKAIALSLGIKTAYKDMTQAEKSQLRYYAILTQVTTAQGDMARTLNAPANQLRILSAQLEMAGRAIGNIFIPALNAVLPYAIAFTNALRQIAQAIAEAFGFEMPEVDYSSITESTTAMSDLDEETSSASKSAKKLKETLADFDELNIIASESGSGSGTGKETTPLHDDWTWELPEYDFLGDAVKSRAEEIQKALAPVVTWVKENLNTIWSVVKDIGALMGLWAIGNQFFKDSMLAHTWLGNLLQGVLAFAEAAATVALNVMFTLDYLETGNFASLMGGLGVTVLGASLFGKMMKGFFEGETAIAAQEISMGVLFLINGTVDMTLATGDIEKNGLTKKNVALMAIGALETSLGAYFVGLGTLTKMFGAMTMGQKIWLGVAAMSLGANIGLNLALTKDALVEEDLGQSILRVGESAISDALTAAGVGVGVWKLTSVPEYGWTAAGVVLGLDSALSIKLGAENAAAEGFNTKNIAVLVKGALEAAGAAALVGNMMWTSAAGISKFQMIAGAAAMGLAIAFGVGLSVYSTSKVHSNEKDWLAWLGKGFGEVLAVGGAAFIAANTLKLDSNGVLGVAGAALTITSIVNLLTTWGQANRDGWTKADIISSVWDTIGAAIGVGMLGAALGASGGVTLLLVAGVLTIGIAATVIMSMKNMKVDKHQLNWGTVLLSAADIQKTAQALFGNISVVANINLANTTVSNMDTAKTNLNTELAKFESSLNLIKLGVDESGSLQSMLNTLTGGASDGTYTDTSLLGQLKTTLDKVKDTVAISVSLMPPTNAEGKAMDAAEMIDALGLSNQLIMTTAEGIGYDLATLLAKGVESGLTDTEKEMVAYLSTWLDDINRAVLEAQYSSEFETKFAFKLNDLDETSFKGVIEAYESTATEMETAYRQLAESTKTALDSSAAGAAASYQYYLKTYGADDSRTKEAYETYKRIQKEADEYDPVATTKAYMESMKGLAWQKVGPSIVSMLGLDNVDDERVNDFFVNGFYKNANFFKTNYGNENFPEMFTNYVDGLLKDFLDEDSYKYIHEMMNTFGVGIFDFMSNESLADIFALMSESTGDVEGTLKLFEQLGLDGAKYFKMGMENEDSDYSNWVKQNFDQNAIDLFMGKSGKEAGEYFAKGMAGASLPTIVRTQDFGSDSISYHWNIPEYAEGGQPVTGELFVAREAGPELVGSIGHKSTVMNNDQIVAGVAGGVAQAQAEQNELLRQQNAYLRIIAAKSGKVTLTPSSELGRVNKRSEEMRLRAEGV